MNTPIKAMTPEEWETNKVCELKNRDHKYMWDVNQPGTAWAQCVHCGDFTQLFNRWNDELSKTDKT